jgi:hypothetical protein
VLEVGVGAMRLSVRKRTILGNSGSWFLERMDLLGLGIYGKNRYPPFPADVRSGHDLQYI